MIAFKLCRCDSASITPDGTDRGVIGMDPPLASRSRRRRRATCLGGDGLAMSREPPKKKAAIFKGP